MATIRKRNGRYHVQIRKNGYPTLTQTFNSITIARKWASGIESDMERRLHVALPDPTRVGELLSRYEREILPNHKSHQVQGYRLNRLKKYFSALKLTDLTSKEVARYRDIRLKDISPASLKRELTILSRVLKVASRDWGISISQNPIGMITLPKADKARTRRLEAGEEQRLLLGANDQLQRIIIVALETGMRRGEILNIKKSDINYSKSVLLIPLTKTDTPRTIPLSSRAITALRAQLRASQRHSGGVISLHEPPLFSYTPRGLSGAFLKLCRKTGIDDLHFHDLRHEATSRLFEKGLNPVEVATITGHKDTKMLMRYTHLRAEDLVKKLG
jgi:integrase